MSRNITFKGIEMHLVGRKIKMGSPAPDFELIGQDMSPRTLKDFQGRIKVLTSFLSLDTSVCEGQVREFNRRAVSLGDEIVVIGISKDLPFAQKRFCDMNGIKNVEVLSDYKSGSFGINYGLLIKEMGLLTRAILIIDQNNILRFLQIVPEASDQPDYNAALDELEEIRRVTPDDRQVQNPGVCQPCEGLGQAWSRESVDAALESLNGWQLQGEKMIVKNYKFKDFEAAVHFTDTVANIAAEQNHHPQIVLDYNKVKIVLWTHTVDGLTKNDFILAQMIDESLDETDPVRKGSACAV